MDINKINKLDTEDLFGMSNNHIIGLILILIVGLFLRVGMIDMLDETIPLRNDAMEYYSYAINLKESGIYSMTMPPEISGIDGLPEADSTRPPGYPMAIYPLVEMPPTEDMVHRIRLLQVVLSTLTIFLAFLTVRLIFAPGISLGISFLVALSPHLISMNIYILTETLFTFLLVLFVYIMALALGKRHILLFFAGGATLACLVLVKSSISLFVYFFLVLFLIGHREKRDFKNLAVFLFVYFMIQVPWFIHNASVAPDANEKSKSLVSLQNGSYPGLMYNDLPESLSIPHRADPNYDNINTYSEFIADLDEKVRNNPGKYLHWYAIGKLLMMYSWDMVAGAGDIYVYSVGYSPYFDRQPFIITHQFMKLIHVPLMLLSIFAMFLVLWNQRTRRIANQRYACLVMLCLISLYFVGLHILVTPLPRYMIPLRPLTYALAVYAGMKAIEFARHKMALISKPVS